MILYTICHRVKEINSNRLDLTKVCYPEFEDCLEKNIDKSDILFHNYYQMSSNSEIKNKDIIERKPYFTKQELSFLLEKQGRNLDKKLSRLLKTNYLLRLKNGLYTTNLYAMLHKASFSEYTANMLYYPSYLSLEYVLQKEGLIPEAVYQYTSISAKTSRVYQNQLGVFTYKKIKDSLFIGYIEVIFHEYYRIKIATKAKALFDYFYLKPMRNIESKQLIDDLRIQWEIFNEHDWKEFERYIQLSESKKMTRIYTLLKKRLQ